MAGFHLTVLSWMFYISIGVISSINGESDKRLLMEVNYSALVQRLDALESEVSAIKHNNVAESRGHIAFMAYLTKTVTGQNHHIYFDDVKVNRGDAYNPHHGMFVAPVNGTYLFSVTACCNGGHYIVLELMVNSQVVGKLRAGDNSYDECSTKVFVQQLHIKDDVYVQHETVGDNLLGSSNNGDPSFIGVLLFE